MIEVLREVWRITEYRDGAVYKAVYVEDRWVPLTSGPLGRPDNDPDLFFAVKSTHYEGPMIRTRR